VCNALALCTNPRVLPMGRQARRFRRCRSVGAPLRDVLPSPPTFGVRKRRRASTPHGQSGGAEPSGHFIAAEPGKGSLVASRQSGHLNHAQRPAIRVSLAGHPSCRATHLPATSSPEAGDTKGWRQSPRPFNTGDPGQGGARCAQAHPRTCLRGGFPTGIVWISAQADST
jgi:hypothetical protein